MTKNLTKDKCVIARCTEKEKDQIKRKANRCNKTEGQYIVDCAIAGLERKSDKCRKHNKEGIEFVELVNSFRNLLIENRENMSTELYEKLYKKHMEMEDKSLCLF